jgi:cerevisin
MNLTTFALLVVSLVQSQAIPGQYIISFDNHARSSFESNVQSIEDQFIGRNFENQILHKYDTVLNGISAKLDRRTLERVKALPNVESVEEDAVVKAFAVQKNSTWGLARVSQRPKLGPAPYSYKYDENAGEGVNIYIFDTGININHKDFGGRASWGVTYAPVSKADDDFQGHGTHCAGTAAGTSYGVAKKAKVVAVKVLGDDAGGSMSGIVAGINWVVKNKSGVKGNVMSMSLGAGLYEPLNKAVNDAVDQGLVAVVAAGNANSDSCLVSPASASKAITVGSIDVNDNKWAHSNYGACVDIHAPGVNILSTYIGSNTATEFDSGTSMAAPHVSGLAAALLSQGVPAGEVEAKLKSLGTPDIIKGLPEKTINLMAYSGIN